MSETTLQNYEMFPLTSFLETFPIDYDIALVKHRPNFLLSQVGSIPRDLVEELENTGVFDNADFIEAGEELVYHIQSSSFEYGSILEKILNHQQQNLKLPQVILDPPQNFALVAAHTSSTHNFLSLYWRGLRIKLSKPVDEYWNPIKHELEQYLKMMEFPELIGRISLDIPPHWLDMVSPLSTYVSNLSYAPSLVELALSWGLDMQLLDLFDEVDQQLLAQLFLFELEGIFMKQDYER